MKQDEKWGWKLAWSGVGLTAAGCLLGCLSMGFSGMEGILYDVVVLFLCLVYVAAIYMLVRKFFGKGKR